MNKIGIASDHAGYEMKEFLVGYLDAMGYEVLDFGTHSPDSVDYADFAHPLAEAIENGELERGIALCGSGEGMTMTLNKHQGIRAGLAWEPEIASLIRRHNNANIIVFPARFITNDEAVAMLDAYFAALGLLTLSLGIYYLVAPEKFKEELNIRNRDARTEQVEGSQQGEGALNDILNGFLDGLLHEDEADKSSGKDGEDTAGTRDEPQKDVPENRPETEKTAAAGDNPPAGNTAGRQGGGKTLPGK